MVESTHLGALGVLQLLMELVKHVVVLSDAACVVQVQMSAVQKRVRVASRSLLIAQVTVCHSSLLVVVGVRIVVVLLSWESLQVARAVNLTWNLASRSTY